MIRIRPLIATILLASLLSGSALADAPGDALKAAVGKTAVAKTAKVAVKTHTESANRVLDAQISGTLARGDSDLVSTGEGGNARRVAVGTAVYDRRPEPGGAWRQSARAAPTDQSALGPLALKDGTSLGDPKLYRALTDLGSETLPQGDTRKLSGELDMAAVAAAMQLGPSDAARLQQMQGTVTVWIGPDGRVARHSVRLVVPGTGGPTTLETTADLTDLDAPLVITPP